MDNPTASGVFVLHQLLHDFTNHVSHKMDALLAQPMTGKQLMKCLQRGEDAEFDQLLCTLGCLAEHCLPSLVKILFLWLDDEMPKQNSLPSKHCKSEAKEEFSEKTARKMAMKIVFILVLIEILQQLPVHPLPVEHIQQILNLAFQHFRQASSLMQSQDHVDSTARIVADLFSEVIGIVAKTKFQSVRRKFLSEIEDAKRQEHSTRIILGLVTGMKFFRVKMYPVDDFEASFRFLRELADFFIEAKDRELKHGLSALFVEILIPVAAAVKTEVNVPVLREFVDALYPTSLEMSKRKKNQLAMYPLVTCLLCVSQKQFFLNNWHIFLENCLSNLKHRDQKISRVALESLYRLLWTYTVRIKCESNSATQTRLQSVIKSLFPFGSRAVVPKDTPLSIYVKIIQFIAQERLDFAMKEIIIDLLGIHLSSTRSSRILTLQPERMNIGLRAFLVITDSLQQKDGAPPMPSTVGIMPSGNTLRVKKVFLNKVLTEDDARTIGVFHYHQQVQKALDWMITLLDSQVGQKMMMTQRTSDVIGEENKPKIELFRTCVAAMPRLLDCYNIEGCLAVILLVKTNGTQLLSPLFLQTQFVSLFGSTYWLIPAGDLTQIDLFDLLSRLTIHIDEELRSLSFTSLQLFALDFPQKREDVVATFISFVLKQVNDTHPILLDTALRHLVQLISGWKNKLATHPATYSGASDKAVAAGDTHEKWSPYARIINRIEGFGLVLLCSNRSVTRKLACMLFKEVKLLSKYLEYSKADDNLCIDVLDRLCSKIVTEAIEMQNYEARMSKDEINKIIYVAEQNNMATLVDYSSSWTQRSGNLWSLIVSSFMKPHAIPAFCSSAVEFAWGDVNVRLEQLWQHMDLAQISSSKKGTTIPNTMEQTLILWTNYLVFACSCAPTNVSLVRKQASTAIPAGTSDWYVNILRDTDRQKSTSRLMEQNVTNLRSENSALKECVLHGLGSTNRLALPDLLCVLEPLIKECFKIPRQENVRRKRKRDNLRLMISSLLEKLAKQKVLGQSLETSIKSHDTPPMDLPKNVVLYYISCTMSYLESIDKVELNLNTSSPNQISAQFPSSSSGPFSPPTLGHNFSQVGTTLDDLRMFFASLVTEVLKHLSVQTRSTFLSNDSRRTLFFMFGKWCEKYCSIGGALDRLESMNEQSLDFTTRLHITMLRAECAVLCCGPIFDVDGLCEDTGYLYPWLEGLLDCSNSSVHDVGKEATILLLQQNNGCQSLLNWMIDKCYTGSLLVRSGCFLGICAAFSESFHPSNVVPLINLAIFCMGNHQLLQSAKNLLLLLQYRLVDDDQTNNLGSYKSVNTFSLDHYYNMSQKDISNKMAKNYPQLSVQVLSDIFRRFQCSAPASQRHMLQYIVPWLENIKLVIDINSNNEQAETGSEQSVSLFVLSNLSFLTTKYRTNCEQEVESCWKQLATSSTENLTCLLKFLTTLLSSHFSEEISTTAQLILTFCAKAASETVLDFLVEECQVFETAKDRLVLDKLNHRLMFICNWPEKQGTCAAVPKTSNSSNFVEHYASLQHINAKNCLQKETSHLTKNNTFSLPDSINFKRNTVKRDPGKPRMSLSLMSLPSSNNKSDLDKETVPQEQPSSKSQNRISNGIGNQRRKFDQVFHDEQLYFLPLKDFLAHDESQSSSLLLRSDIGCVLLYEMIVVHGLPVNLKSCLSKLIMAIIFGMDHEPYLEIPEKCRLLLANIVMMLLPASEQEQIVKEIISISCTALISVLPHNGVKYNQCEYSDMPIHARPEVSSFTKSFVLDLFTKNKQMWPCDDILSVMVLNNTRLKGEEELAQFVNKLLVVFSQLVPDLSLREKLSKQAIYFSINAKPVHYRCRSLQVFRAIGIPLSPKNICAIAQPLSLEHCESDEIQSLKIEILQTLQHSCDAILKSFTGNNSIGVVSRKHNQYKSVTSTDSMDFQSGDKPVSKMSTSSKSGSFNRTVKSHSHKRSGSVTLKCKILQRPEHIDDVCSTTDGKATEGKVEKAKPYTSSKASMHSQHLDIEKQSILQIFWIATAVLETEFEFEYLLSLKILSNMLTYIPLDTYDWSLNCKEYIKAFQWTSFQGLQPLLFKGLLSAHTFDSSFSSLSCVTTLTHLPVVSTKGQGNAFATNVILLLPYLVSKFNSPDSACCDCAQNIAQVCVVDFNDHIKLQSLAHVMSLYVNKTYNKALSTWINVVCKYIYETFPSAFEDQIHFLTEILKKGYSLQLPCLQIMLSLFTLSNVLSKDVSKGCIQDSLQAVANHIHGKHWKDALSILKLAVTRSSYLVSPQVSSATDVTKDAEKDFVGLPGLTLSFQFNGSNLPKHRQHTKLYDEKGASNIYQNTKTDHFHVLLYIFTYFQHTAQMRPAVPIVLQPCKETTEKKQTTDGFVENKFSGGSKSIEKLIPEDTSSQGVLRDFDFLNEFEMEGDPADNIFNSGMQWGTSSTKEVNIKDLNGSEDPLDVFDLTAIANMEENEKNDSDSSSVITISSVVGVSSDVSDGDQCLKEVHHTSCEGNMDEDKDKAALELDKTSDTLLSSYSSCYIRSTSPSPPDTSLKTQKESLIELKVHPDSPLYSKVFSNVGINDDHNDVQIVRWNGLINLMESDGEGKTFLELFLSFQSLYHQLCLSFTIISKRGCSVLGSKLAGISSHFKQLACPLCLATPNTINTYKAELSLGFRDLQEHVKFFQIRKQDVVDTLDIVGVGHENLPQKYDMEQKQLELCQQLYKLHFELLVLFQLFNKLVNLVSSPRVQDKAHGSLLNSLYRDLVCFESTSAVMENSNHNIRKFNNANEAAQYLVDLLLKKDFRLVFYLLGVYRNLWPFQFGLETDFASSFLMNLYFWHHVNTTSKKEYQVILGTKDCTPSISVKLMEVNCQIQHSLQLLGVKP